MKRDEGAKFNWKKKGPGCSSLAVGRNELNSGQMKGDELMKQLPKLAS